MLYKVVSNFESVDGILKCGHSIENFKNGQVTRIRDNKILNVLWLKKKLLSTTFLWYCLFFVAHLAVLIFECVDEILGLSLKALEAVLSHGIVLFVFSN